MNELTQLGPRGNGHQADDVVAYLRGIGRDDLIDRDGQLREHLPETPAAVRDPSGSSPRIRFPVIRGASLTAVTFAVVLLAVETVIAAESWRGLTGFGHLIGISGRAAWGVPVTLDGVGLIAALIALRAELEGIASAPARVTLFIFTAASAAANWWHGLHFGGIGAALYLGGMSLAVAWVFDLILRGIRSSARRRSGRLPDPLPKFGLSQWARYPRLTFTALSLAVRDGHKTPRAALDAAKAVLAARKAAKLPELPIDGETLATLTPRDRLAVAFGAVGSVDVTKALALLEHHGCPVDQSHCYQIRRSLLAGKEG
jgi:Protein of unknown function (DUF2637)